MAATGFIPAQNRTYEHAGQQGVTAAVADRNLLPKEELKAFHRSSNLRGAWELFWAWGTIVGVFAVMAFWTNPLTILAGLVLLGGRQMALAALMHEAAHRSLFKSKTLNDALGKWAMGAPILEDVDEYRPYHFQHHKYTGQPHKGKTGDPDLILIRPYPLAAKSFYRWLRNDLFGVTGWRIYRMRIGMKLGLFEMKRGRLTRKDAGGPRAVAGRVVKHYGASMLTHAIGLTILTAVGAPYLYLVWMAAQITIFHLIMRVRVIAEHGMTERTSEMRHNTRTTQANLIEKLFFAPHNLNYHLEHHLYPGVPCYHLKKLHKRLKEVGALDDAVLSPGYLDVIRQASSKVREAPPRAA